MAQVRDVAVYASAKGWTVAVGGNGGSKPATGTTVASGLSDEEALAVVDKIYTYIEEKKTATSAPIASSPVSASTISKPISLNNPQ